MPENSFSGDDIEKKVKQAMLDSGWQSDSILHNLKIPSHRGFSLEVDFILLYELYPLATVEVKSKLVSKNLPLTVLRQASSYAATTKTPFVVATDGDKYISKNLTTQDTKEWARFPTPQELWKELGRKFDLNDPRLAPALNTPNRLRLHQILSIKANLDSIVSGQKNGITIMPMGSGRLIVIAQIIHKLIRSRKFHRLLYVSDRVVNLHDMAHFLSKYQELEPFISRDFKVFEDKKIYFLTINKLNKLKEEIFLEEGNDFDQVFITYPVQLSKKLNKFAENNPRIQVLSFLSHLQDIDKDHKHSVNIHKNEPYSFNADLEEDFGITVPKNHRPVTIGEIAENIFYGIHLGKETTNLIAEEPESIDPKKQALLLGGRNILTTGEIGKLDTAKVIDLEKIDDTTLDKYLLKPGDILLPSVSNKLDAVAMVPENSKMPMLFGNMLVRIRIDPKQADPLSVFSFMRTDFWRTLLSRNVSSSVGISRVSVRSVEQTTIFLPEKTDKDDLQSTAESSQVNAENDFSNLTSAINQLQEDVLPQLQELKQQNDTRQTTQDGLSEVSRQLRRIASSIALAPLSERILSEYPTPIALAFRRFQDSRFNVYEQTQRLRDLFEASFIFIYNLMLADWLKNLDPEKYYIEDGGSRRSYKTFALSRKNDFLKAIIDIAKSNSGQDLFVSELVQSNLTDLFEDLKDLRNQLAHTATATRSKQKKILSDNEPIILSLLEDLEFLCNYQLVRVPQSYRKGGKNIYRMEIYKGVAPQLKEEPLDDDAQYEYLNEDLKMAEHDHLVLLRDDFRILDLYPLYQLVDNERTQYEPQICFFKQHSKKKQDGNNSERVFILDGESSHGSEPFPLEGVEEFEQLITNILETKPE